MTRRIAETLVIDESIRIAILGIRRGKVRIGVDSPVRISVMRSAVRKKEVSPEIVTP